MSIIIEETVRIPDGVTDLASFRHWAYSDDFPTKGRISFLNGEVWVDMSPENLFSHNQVKGEFASVLATLVKSKRLGRYFHDRTLLSHIVAGLSTEPDGLFISYATLNSGRINLVGEVEDSIELEGSPDMVLEVLSKTSTKKDMVVLRDLYWRAGITEYWLADARRKNLRFEILKYTDQGYIPVEQSSGWQESKVFGKSFKLTAGEDESGYPEYTLSVR